MLLIAASVQLQLQYSIFSTLIFSPSVFKLQWLVISKVGQSNTIYTPQGFNQLNWTWKFDLHKTEMFQHWHFGRWCISFQTEKCNVMHFFLMLYKLFIYFFFYFIGKQFDFFGWRSGWVKLVYISILLVWAMMTM